MLILSEREVAERLDMAACITAIDEAQRALSRGATVLPVRMTLGIPELGELNVMPGSLGDGRGLGAKLVTFAPANQARGLPVIQAVLVLLDPTTGVALAIVEAAHLTAVRTAAASAVATRALALEEAASVALIGAGAQARSHLAAMVAVRPVGRVSVWSPSGSGAREFVESQGAAYPEIEFSAPETARSAIEGAEIVCTVSLATQPVVEYSWLRPGCHINAVGSHSPAAREIDSETMARSRVIVDSRQANLTECGDCLIPIDEGLFAAEHVSDEIGEVLLGRKPGRESGDQITVYQSCGLAIQDVAVGRLLLET